MPSDPMTNPAGSTLNQKPEVRRAMPAGPEKPQWLEGRLTYIGLVLAAVGSIGRIFGLNLPTSEADGFLHLISDNWETIATGIGLLTAAWGRVRINFRKAAPVVVLGMMLAGAALGADAGDGGMKGKVDARQNGQGRELVTGGLKSALLSRSLGWRSAPHHKKGLRQMVGHPRYAAAPLPGAASVREMMPPVYDQGQLGSCTAQAGSAAFDCVYKAAHGAFAGPSRLDLYQLELLHDGPARSYATLEDRGSYTASILEVLQTRGVCREKLWAYNPGKLRTAPPQCAVKARAALAAVRGYDVDTTDGRSIKEAIANARRPVVFGAIVFRNIFNVSRESPVVPMPAGAVAGGHEMVFVGYDDDRQAYLVRNSWGTGWGDGGHAWMPYAYVHATKPNGAPRWVEDALVIEEVR